MQKVGGIWSHIIFPRILVEGADEDQQIVGYLNVGGIWSPIIFRQLLFNRLTAMAPYL